MLLKETIKKGVVKDMKELGVYKPGYEGVIDIYCELMEQYKRLTKEFKDNKYNYAVTTADGGEKKSPLLAALESLRKDLIQYADRLCLTPKSLLKEEPKKPKGKSLAELLSGIDG